MELKQSRSRPWIISILIKVYENDVIYIYPNTNFPP
jgi:hypothetical protein